ncbi:MAG TPA: ABC transporter substrate-binding protein [Candidatus Binatia bacterium]
MKILSRTGTVILTAIFFAFCSSVEAQQPKKIPRIGYVSDSGEPSSPGPQIEAFRQGLRDLGYVEGQNIFVEYRYGEGQSNRYASLVTELLQLKVDVLVVRALPSIRAAKQATQTIPIVMVTTQDPMATGLIDRLAQPGGNVTGLTTLQRELSGKRLELLKEVLPGISRMGALANAEQLSSDFPDFKWYEASARALNIQLQPLPVRRVKPDLDAAFENVAKGRLNALITISGSLLNRYKKQIADRAIKSRLASMYERTEYVIAGGLMSYSADDRESFRRAAVYVDKILKGARPADLPIEQASKFEMVINLKTAKQIGVIIPPNVLARADRVIK